MIIFHEGMPRSGKSYAALKDHVIPALVKGRTVYARIDGLNYKQIADLANITVERCRELLIELTEAQCQALTEVEFDQDALIVIDEAQNYWPTGRGNLTPDLLKWIAEHGHHGHDVLLMGQLLKDVHRSWVNRTNRKVQFVKKDVVGKADEYKWIMYHGRPDGEGRVKFTEATRGDEKYDDRYFGCYKSHSDGTENKANYADDRINIFKSRLFRRWLPLIGIASLLAVGYLVYLFKGGGFASSQKAPPAVQKTSPGRPNPAPVPQPPVPEKSPASTPASSPTPAPSKAADEWDLADVVTRLSRDNRPRLAGVLRSARETRVVVEWRDAAQRVVESMTSDQLRVLGWYPLVTDDDRMAVLLRPGHRIVATSWPIEEQIAKVTRLQVDQIKGEGVPGAR